MNSTFTTDDYKWMAYALKLAENGLYTTDPNPRVACVLVKNKELVGKGWHQKAGESHAEVIAINDAGEAAYGSTAYVTLEPCSHTGRTPPCVNKIIEAGINRVVIAMQDPNPIVCGDGIKCLKEAGLNVEVGLLEEDAIKLNPGFVMRMTHNRPYVRLKLAMSLDGRTALASGESQWITGQSARDDVQRLRARSSAVLTGVGTILADNPSLNVRLESPAWEGFNPSDVKQPLRVVLDSELRIPDDATLLKLPSDVLIVTTSYNTTRCQQLSEKPHVEVIQLPPEADGRPKLSVLLSILSECGINELHVECGSTLAGKLLSEGLVDEFICYVAPHILGDTAQGLFNISPLQSMKDKIKLNIQDIRTIGEDIRITITPKEKH